MFNFNNNNKGCGGSNCISSSSGVANCGLHKPIHKLACSPERDLETRKAPLF